MIDPFATAPADDESQVPEPVDETPFEEPPVEAPKKAPAKKAVAKPASKENELSEGKIVTTYKEGAGFDASWVVTYASTVEEADALLDDAFAAYLDRVKKVASYFRGGDTKSSGSGAPARPGAEAPAGTPAAPGPDWTYKTGVGKTGKTWRAWMPPRGSDDQPVWL